MLKLKGKVFDYQASILDEATGQTAATIQRQLSGADLLFGKQTYHVIVTPGYDLSVITAMCICLDEKKNEGGGLVI